jgi:RNA polymerase sigma-70 factor (ECF subfamily)
MATDAAIYPTFPVQCSIRRGLAGSPEGTILPGMAATRANNGEKSAEERMQARAPEMELIREAQAGSRAAFDTLVRQYEQQVLRLALHLTGSEHDAEDIYQEAFLKAYRYIGNFRFECSFYTWIYRIVTNLCLDQMRRRKTRREDHAVVVDHSGDEIDLLASVSDDRSFSNPAKELDRKVLGERIQAALEKLTPRERMVFELKHYQGLRLRDDRGDAEHHGRDRQEYALPGDEEVENAVGGVAVEARWQSPKGMRIFAGARQFFEAGRT